MFPMAPTTPFDLSPVTCPKSSRSIAPTQACGEFCPPLTTRGAIPDSVVIPVRLMDPYGTHAIHGRRRRVGQGRTEFAAGLRWGYTAAHLVRCLVMGDGKMVLGAPPCRGRFSYPLPITHYPLQSPSLHDAPDVECTPEVGKRPRTDASHAILSSQSVFRALDPYPGYR